MPTFYQIQVTDVIDPLHFWAHIGTTESFKHFADFEKKLAKHYAALREKSSIIHLKDIAKKTQRRQEKFVLVHDKASSKAYRGIVSGVNWVDDEVDIFFSDYGWSKFVKRESILVDVPNFVHDWPAQAWRCILAGIAPIASTWLSRALDRFRKLVLFKSLNASILGFSEGSYIVTVDIITSESGEESSVTEILVEEGCGKKTQLPGQSLPQYGITKSNNLEAGDGNIFRGQNRDYEKEVFRSGVNPLTQSSAEDFGGSDLHIGSSQFPAKDFFQSIQEQIERCQELHENLSSGSSQGTPTRPLSDRESTPGRQNTEAIIPGNQRNQRQGRGRGLRSAKSMDYSRSPGRNVSASSRESTPDKVIPNPKRSTKPPFKKNDRLKRNVQTKELPKAKPVCEDSASPKDKFMSDVQRVLNGTTNASLRQDVEALIDIVVPVKSLLGADAEESEMLLFLRTMVDFAVQGGSPKIEITLEILCAFNGFPEFSNTLIEVIRQAEELYVKVPANTLSADLCTSFCNFLGRLYVSSEVWEENGVLTVCVIDILEKWALYRVSEGNPTSEGLMKVYAHCLTTVLKINSQSLMVLVPSEMEGIYGRVRDLLFSRQTPRDCKDVLLQIFVQIEHVKKSNQVSQDNIHTSVSIPKDVHSVSTQTEAVSVAAPCDTVVGNRGPIQKHRSQAKDSYYFIRNMLGDLDLEDLLPLFTENAIRDSVIRNVDDFEDIKQLLRECGVLPGQILEIKAYVTKHRTALQNLSNGHDAVKQKSHSPVAFPSAIPQAVRLISPQQFEKPSSLSDSKPQPCNGAVQYQHNKTSDFLISSFKNHNSLPCTPKSRSPLTQSPSSRSPVSGRQVLEFLDKRNSRDLDCSLSDPEERQPSPASRSKQLGPGAQGQARTVDKNLLPGITKLSIGTGHFNKLRYLQDSSEPDAVGTNGTTPKQNTNSKKSLFMPPSAFCTTNENTKQ